MASKDDLQNALKEKYGINKNISQPLSKEECERLLNLLHSEASAVKLVSSYADKNFSLGRKNANYGSALSRAEHKFEVLQAEHLKLKKHTDFIEQSNTDIKSKQKLLEENEKLKAEAKDLFSKNQSLNFKIQNLITQNNDLSVANKQLKEENKDLKNIVDQIRLKLARDTKRLLQYEDSEIRKAVIRLFNWTLG